MLIEFIAAQILFILIDYVEDNAKYYNEQTQIMSGWVERHALVLKCQHVRSSLRERVLCAECRRFLEIFTKNRNIK